MYAALRADAESLDWSEIAWKQEFLLSAWKLQHWNCFPQNPKREASLILSNLKTILCQEKLLFSFFSFFILEGGGPD